MSATRTRRKPAPKPVPRVPLYLRLALLDTDGEENRVEVGPYFAPNEVNLRALLHCIDHLEGQRKQCTDPIPVIQIVREPLVIQDADLDQEFTKLDAHLLYDEREGGAA